MKFTRTLLCTAMGLAVMHGAAAADLSKGDQRFMRKAAESGMLEMQASEIAAQKAQHPEVKRYAEMMLKDHGEADKELKALAGTKGFQLPTELEGGKARLIKKLHDKEGHDFDEEYVDEVAVDAHDDAVDLFKDAADDAEDADVKAFAAKLLPVLKRHHEQGEQLEDTLDKADDRGTRRSNADTTAPATREGSVVVPGTAAQPQPRQ